MTPARWLPGIGALAAVVALGSHLDSDWAAGSRAGGYAIWVVLLPAVHYLGARAVLVKGRRLRNVAVAFAVVVAVIELVGQSINTTGDLSLITASPGRVANALLFLAGFGWLIYAVCVVLLGQLTRSSAGRRRAALSEVSIWPGIGRWLDRLGSFYRQRTKAAVLLAWLVMSLGRVPYLLWTYPGVVTVDAMRQIEQVTGLAPLSNHHPIVHTLILAPFIRLGEAVGSVDLGVTAYSVFQICLTSAAFVYAVIRLRAWRVPRSVVMLVYCFFSLFPMHSLYAVTMWKNIPFASAMLVLIVQMIDLWRDGNAFSRRPSRLVWLGVMLLSVSLLRNDGIVVAVATAAVLAVRFHEKGNRRPLAVAVIALALFGVVRIPGFKALGVEEGSVAEALSLPAQQIALTSKNHPQEIGGSQAKSIGDLFGGRSIEEIGSLYQPTTSNPVKNSVDVDYLRSQPIAAVKAWAGLGLDYPADYLSSFLVSTHGYWYPEFTYWTWLKVVIPVPGVPTLHERPRSEAGSTDSQVQTWLAAPRQVPVISMVYSIGFSGVLLAFAGAAFIVQRRSRYLAIFVPLVALWLTCMASPVWGEYRYAYGYIIAVPVVLAFALNQRELRDH